MTAKSVLPAAPFGTLLGVSTGEVEVYSSDYDTVDKDHLSSREAFRSYVDGEFMGYKWQCVELARRWLYINRGYVFDDIAMAYDIFRLDSVRRVKDGALLPLKSFANGAPRTPEPGCMLIWSEGGEYDVTGHVAIVTEVFPDRIRVVEQNIHDSIWPDGQSYSRELKARQTPAGNYWVECSYRDASVLGWVVQTADTEHAEEFEPSNPALFDMQLRELPEKKQGKDQQKRREEDSAAWLNEANDDEAAYVAMMGGHKLSSPPDDARRYFVISETAATELKRATNELHAIFMHATHLVMQDEGLLTHFNLPAALWPKIRQSWNNRRNQMVTGRFDFSMSKRGLKMFEYNCDSASCYMECGKVQGLWAKHYGCKDGNDAGAPLFEALAEAWQERGIEDVLHIMHDDDPEEIYHALYMQSAIEAAGIRCKIISGVQGLSWAGNGGDILDADGEMIRWVWKTWAWETALDQIRSECEDDAANLENYEPGELHNGAPRLVDVLLRHDLMVFEPLWTLIPSNKAILPILWKLFPDHPYLLECGYELTDELRAKGYVSKPIVGRCGANISIVDRHDNVVEETSGRFDDQAQVYQQLFRLPELGGYSVQVSSFSAAGTYAGSTVRVDPTAIVTASSDVMALRTIADDALLAAQ